MDSRYLVLYVEQVKKKSLGHLDKNHPRQMLISG